MLDEPPCLSQIFGEHPQVAVTASSFTQVVAYYAGLLVKAPLFSLKRSQAVLFGSQEAEP